MRDYYIKKAEEFYKDAEANYRAGIALNDENMRLRKVLREIFELLEEHEPPWYLRRHYNDIKQVLEGGSENA